MIREIKDQDTLTGKEIMMSDQRRDDIRKLLRTFGVKADETISRYLEDTPGSDPLTFRITLEDVTEYQGEEPEERLNMVIEQEVQRE